MTDPDRTAGRWRLSRWTLLAVVVGSVLVGVFLFGLMRALFGTDPPAPTPTGVNAFGGIVVGPLDARARVDVYLDLQCADCRSYLDGVDRTLDEAVAAGRAQVVYHPVAFLDRDSSTRYPTRAAAAGGCAAEAGVYPAFQRSLLAEMPPPGGAGLPDERLIELGRQAGAGEPFAECVRSGRFESWVSKMTSRAYNIGVKTMPTVLVDDGRVGLTDQALREAIAGAR
jgi:protein-disulfide isomerase